MTPVLFTAGGATLDCIITAEGALALNELGGNAVHSAVGAALFGVRVGIVARVPAGWPVETVAEAGLLVGGVRIEDVPMPAPEWFFYRADGSRCDRLHATAAEAEAFGIIGNYVPQERARAWEEHLRTRTPPAGFAAFRAAHPVGPEHVPSSWWSARGVHVGPGRSETQLALARAARGRGLVVTLDPGFTARDLAPDLLTALLSSCDVFLPSEAELSALRPGLSPAEAVVSLGRPDGPVILAKLGAAGALLLEPGTGSPLRLSPLPVIAADPTGAGDAFAGGLLSGLVAGETVRAAALRALVAGATAAERPGALAPLSLPQSEIAARRAAIGAIAAGVTTWIA